MALTKFANKMKAAASAKPDEKSGKKINLTVTLSEDDYILIARIARATDEKITAVAREIIESQSQSLVKLASTLEKLAPKSRISRPLIRERKRTAPNVRSLKSYVEAKRK